MSHNAPHFHRRKGAMMVLAGFCLVLCLVFTAFSVDLGVISLTKAQMQAAVDSAALAAAQELTDAVYQSGEHGTDPAAALASAKAGARSVAVNVAHQNGVYIDPDVDVFFGQRTINEDGDWSIDWAADPPNVVRVVARRDNPDGNANDGKLQLSFARAAGLADSAEVTAKATAYVEARDIVVTLDFSGSMNDDSTFSAMSNNRLGKTEVENNLDDIWNALVASGVTYSNSSDLKFPSSGYGQINSYYGTYKSSNDDNTVYYQLGLDGVRFPQEGKYNNGTLKGRPSNSTSKSLWKNYINWVRRDSAVGNYGYRKRYGYRTLMAYLGEKRASNKTSEDLWRAPYYPFHAMKEGVTMFHGFLDSLDYGDHGGLVSYATSAVKEHQLNYPSEPDVPQVDLGATWITGDYAALDAIQRHKQASHYSSTTGMGYGVKYAREMLNDYKRDGTRPTILLMTDGLANQYPNNFNLYNYWPGWQWSDVTDFDDDGSADYSTSTKAKQYAFYEVRKCIEAGFIVHTMTVGSNADESLMQAIAKASGGVYYHIPVGANLADFEHEMEEVFQRIAANVPPAKLLHTETEE